MSYSYRRKKKNLRHFKEMAKGLSAGSPAEKNEAEKMARLVKKDAPDSFQVFKNGEKV